MNNRGFTLIEITAIVVILVAIFLVSYPAYLSTAKVDKQKQYDDMVDNLCLAGETYIYSNLDMFSNISTVNEEIVLEIKTLISYGNVDANIKNPNTNNYVDNDSLKYTVESDNSLSCQYIEE